MTRQRIEMEGLGLPIAELQFDDWPPEWSVTGTTNVSILKNPPHPAATKLLVNWLLSEEGWNARVQDIRDNPDVHSSGHQHAVSLHTGRSNEHVPPELRLPANEALYLSYSDPGFWPAVEEGREWLKKIITDAGIQF